MTVRHTHQPYAGAILTLPNILTLGRILLVVAMVGTYYMKGDSARWLAVGIFAVAGITDFFDGYLARAWAQQSRLGQMLDPIADKLLVAAALILITAWHTASGLTVIPVVVILSREILVSGLREFLANASVSVPVTLLAKWKTTMQMLALGFLLAGPAGEKVIPHTVLIGEAGLWIAAILTFYTGFDYFRAGFRHILDENGR